MGRKRKWKSLEDIADYIDKARSFIEKRDYYSVAKKLSCITFDYLLVWGHYDLIIDLWGKCIKKLSSPQQKMEAHNNIGLAYNYKGEPDKALIFLEQGLNRNYLPFFIGLWA